MSPVGLVLTCEHAGRRVPRCLLPLFRDREDLLASHRGWDRGALALSRTLAHRLGAPLVATTITRLVVEVNRSPGHPALFSEVTRGLPASERRRILTRWYEPHRRRVEAAVRQTLEAHGRVLHVGVHTFTPILEGVDRRCDVGLLYDPQRAPEKRFAACWLDALETRADLRLRRNHPYRGRADGLVTWLRRRIEPEGYLGIELEVSQAWPMGSPGAWQLLRRHIADTLGRALGADPSPDR